MFLLIWRFRDKLRAMEKEYVFRYILAFALIISEMSYYWRLVGVPDLGPNPVDHLPIAVMAVVAYCANQILDPGANYLFMAKPEDTPSVLDILPPNFALRICIMGAVIALMYFLAYLPWYLKDRKAAKAPATEAE